MDYLSSPSFFLSTNNLSLNDYFPAIFSISRMAVSN